MGEPIEYVKIVGYSNETGEEVARIRVKIEIIKNTTIESMAQLEGFVKGKWRSLIRYHYDKKQKEKKTRTHIDKEYLGLKIWEKLVCPPERVVARGKNYFYSLNDEQIKELIKKREDVFRKEGK